MNEVHGGQYQLILPEDNCGLHRATSIATIMETMRSISTSNGTIFNKIK